MGFATQAGCPILARSLRKGGIPQMYRAWDVLHLPLGGAAVHRCDTGPVSRTGFSRRGETAVW
jgi:hypothetical protein